MKEDSYRDLYIDEVWVAKHKDCPRGAIGIDWHGAPGFGTYELHIGKDGKLHCRSEYMDSQDDKRFPLRSVGEAGGGGRHRILIGKGNGHAIHTGF